MGGEEKRHQMMQNLFGDQSEEEEEEEEDVESEHESNPQPNYASDEAEGELRREGEEEIEGEGNEEAESEGEIREAEGEAESEGEIREAEGEADPGESEGEREASSVEVGAAKQKEESDEKEEYGHRGAAGGRRRDVVESGSEEQQFRDVEDDDEVDQEAGSPRSLEEKSAPEIRDVFGDSDEEEDDGYAAQNNAELADVRSPLEDDEGYGKDLRPEDVIADEDGQMQSEEEENFDVRRKEKPVGPPLEIEIPFRLPPADPTKMNLIKVSNIMGINPKPFDPKTYVEEKTFVTDESGTQKRIRLENNIVRWRTVKNKDGTTSVESNARFVRWSDGSLQLLIGNEVLDISVQDAQHEQTHLFMRHNKSLLQSQGRILQKMRFMPSSLTSNSHRQLTQLVDSRHRKVYKVKNCVTDIDPEREKEEKEKAESQNIRASVLLNRKKEKVSRKYTQSVDRRRQLSPGFLEDALDEDDEQDYYDPRRSRRRFEEDLEEEARAEKRIMNAKKGHKDLQRKPGLPAAKASKSLDYSESDREESEYETDGEEDERSPPRNKAVEPEQEYEEDEEDEPYEEEPEVDAPSDEEDEPEEPKQRGKESESGRKLTGIESDEDSPPRKKPNHRRMAVVYDSDDE